MTPNNLLFQTLSPKTTRIVAVCTFAVGVGGMIWAFTEINGEHRWGAVLGSLFALIFIVTGFIGPGSIQLFTDKLSIRKSAWRKPKEFLLDDVKEIHFDTDKRGKYFSIRTNEATEVIRFAQHDRVISVFAKQLEKMKVRVSGKR